METGARDRELIERAKRGDNAAFGQVWARYETQVVALCRRYLSGPHRDPAVDEYDLAAAAFIRALHQLDRYEDRIAHGAGFETWLLEVAKRICLNFLTKQRRRQQWTAGLAHPEELDGRPDVAATPEQVVTERQVLRQAALAINALPDLYRTPFKLFLEDCSHREIAAAVGISVETAAKRVQRARALLQPRLAGILEIEYGQAPPRVGLRGVEQALTAIVSDDRIVTLTLPTGGEMQLLLRVDRHKADRGPEIERLRERLRGRPRAWKQRLELAEICYHSGRWHEAQREYREVLAIHPACFAAALRLGEMLCREGSAASAVPIYVAALEQAPPPAVAAQLKAHRFVAEGRDEGAVAAFRQAIRLAPGEKANYYGLHQALGRLSRYEEQLATLAAVRELDPDDRATDPQALVEVYGPCAQLWRWDLARTLLERAVELDPNNLGAIQHLFEVRMNLRLLDAETLGLAEQLVRLAPHFFASWGHLAWIYEELGRDEESLAVQRQCVQEHPDNAEALAGLAWRCHYLGRAEEAVACARRAYALEPHNPHICWTLLTAFNHPLVSEAEALQHAEEIAARFPHDAAVMYWVSAVYGDREREAESLEYARRAVALGPNFVEAQERLAELYARFHHWEAAAELYERLARITGGDRVGALANWARALYPLNAPRAAALFAEAEALARSPLDHLVLGHAYAACGRLDNARAAFRRCLSQIPLRTRDRIRAEDGLRRLGAPTAANRR